MNVSLAIGAIVSRRLATLVELDSVLGTRDMYDLLEVIAVDAYNERMANEDR